MKRILLLTFLMASSISYGQRTRFKKLPKAIVKFSPQHLVRNGLKVGASGASNISLSGTATDADFNVSGACSIKSLELVTENCTVEESGASNVKLTINKYLKANISGASDIRYKGTVSRFDTKSSGASSIKPL